MRWCAVIISACVFLTGCVATVQDTSALSSRVSKLEHQVSGIERGSAGSSSTVQKDLEQIAQNQKYLKADQEELNQAVARVEEQAGELRLEVSRLQERFDQLETGSIQRAKSIEERAGSVSALEQRYDARLAQLQKDVDKALQEAMEANSRSQKTLAELTDRIKLIAQKIDQLAYVDTPPSKPAPPAPNGAKIHTVKAGETASAIAAKYGITLQKLRDTNPHIPDLNVIRPGDELLIP
jgi:LysM repeat protein